MMSSLQWMECGTSSTLLSTLAPGDRAMLQRNRQIKQIDGRFDVITKVQGAPITIDGTLADHAARLQVTDGQIVKLGTRLGVTATAASK